jgi:hypothetical protein
MKGARIGKPAVEAMPTWAILKRAAKRFQEDELSDRAAALTYFAVLALFPALIVMVALLGLLGEYPRTSNALLEIVGKISPGSAVDTFRGPITGVVRAKGGAGALFGVGLAAHLGHHRARLLRRPPSRRRHRRRATSGREHPARRTSDSCAHVGIEGGNHAIGVRGHYVSVRAVAVAALRAAARTSSVGGLSAASSARYA